ncbi:MAG: hypothetical protein PHC61_08935 [Chitinivibrionales bacterium]|nr:hypothetical protein [Chitinivibrionales bacterium]
MSYFEVGMLVCFGISWPFSIIKTLRTRCTAGKSALFLSIVALGYGFGIAHKALCACDKVIVLYIVNLLLVLTDLFLYFHYREPTAPVGPPA